VGEGIRHGGKRDVPVGRTRPATLKRPGNQNDNSEKRIAVTRPLMDFSRHWRAYMQITLQITLQTGRTEG
jgi:hypothetical protein